MSEHINNSQYRKEMIKKMLVMLHDGKSLEEVKEVFADTFDGVSATEISEAEQLLINEGIPVEEVQKLCDVHAAVFKGSIAEIHASVDPSMIPGHPANTLKQENLLFSMLIETVIQPLLVEPSPENAEKLSKALKQLSRIDIHYSKKENLIFPYLEKYGITAPPKVMWGVDDEIRDELKSISQRLPQEGLTSKLIEDLNTLLTKILDMIYKEEYILLPMLSEHLKTQDWVTIDEGGNDFEELVAKLGQWKPIIAPEEKTETPKEDIPDGIIVLPSGQFKVNELTALLNTLPFDITFVDKDDKVKYFSQGKERIFARTKAIIGREVSNCHPPASVHVVEGIVADLKSGKKDHEDFWISMKDAYILIRYFAIRDEAGEYLGVLEVSQNIKPIQAITGEKRLV